MRQHFFIPVIYRKEKLVSDFLEDEQKEKILITKTSKWEYEREWRHLDKCNSGKYYLDIQPTKIFIGHNISQENRKRIIEFAEKRGIIIIEPSAKE